MTVKRDDGGVIEICVQRALLEIERENCELMRLEIVRLPSASEAQKFAKLPAPFAAVMFAGEERIKKIKFAGINGGVFVAGKKRRNGQRLPGFIFFGIKKRAGGFGAVPIFKRQLELVKKKTSRKGLFTARQSRRQKKQDSGAKPAENYSGNIKNHLALSLLNMAYRLVFAISFMFNIDIDFRLLCCIFGIIEVFTSVPPDPVPAICRRRRVFFQADAIAPASSAARAETSSRQSCRSRCRRT